MTTTIELKSIGSAYVQDGRFFIDIDSEYRDALKNINGFSHIHLVFWGHQCEEQYRSILVADEPYRRGPSEIGVFATRSEYRPNPILISVLQVISVNEKEGQIEVAYHDALSGSPVLDIKPYLPCSDRVADVSVGDWASDWPQYYEDSADFDWPSVFNF